MNKSELQVKITAFSYNAVKNLTQEYKLDLIYKSAKEISKKEYSIQAIISKEQLNLLKEAGYKVEILKDFTTRPDPRLQVSQSNRFQMELEKLKKKQGGNNNTISKC